MYSVLREKVFRKVPLPRLEARKKDATKIINALTSFLNKIPSAHSGIPKHLRQSSFNTKT